MKVRSRFAPSPTGFMHVGNLRTGLYAYLYAKQRGGDFILRIEDTDRERYVEGAVEVIYKTLRTAGIEHDEGPDKDGGVGPYVQSERQKIYFDYAHKLVELGGAYYCFCSKERLESLEDGNGVRKYDKHCLHNVSLADAKARIAKGEPYVIRQNVPTEGVSSYVDMVFGEVAVNCADLEDNILLKSDGMPTYNFANVVDDHLMGITHVIRGTEYLSSTPKYNLVYKSFGWEIPQYMHLPPIMKDATRKLSKRFGDANFDDFIAKGFLPEAIVNYIALLGWAPKDNVEKMTLAELTERFSVDGITKSSSIFDEVKLRWLNSQYLKELSPEKFDALAKPFYEKSVIHGKYPTLPFSKLLLSRVETLGDVVERVTFIEDFKKYDHALFVSQRQKTDAGVARGAIKLALETLAKLSDDELGFNAEAINTALVAGAEAHNPPFTKGQILWCTRVALTGQAVTPGGAAEMAEILGKNRSLARLKESLTWLE